MFLTCERKPKAKLPKICVFSLSFYHSLLYSRGIFQCFLTPTLESKEIIEFGGGGSVIEVVAF